MIIKRGKKYYARFQINGKDTWINTEQTSKFEAKKYEDRIASTLRKERAERSITNALLEQAKLLARKELSIDELKENLVKIEKMARYEALLIINDMIPAPPLLAKDLWQKYLIADISLKESTRKTKEQRFKKFSEWACERDMNKIDHSAARFFLETLHTEKSQTWNNYISDLSSVWKASPELENPWTEALRKKSNVEHKLPFTREDVRQIIKYCDEHELKFFKFASAFAYYTGARLIDVIRFSKYNLRGDGFITFIPEKTHRSGKMVSIQIKPGLQKILDELPPPDSKGFYFPDVVKANEHYRSFSSCQFQDILKKCKIYKKRIGFHSFRHLFVTLAKDSGVAFADIQATVGHDAAAITDDVYYHGIKSTDLSQYPEL